MLFSDALLLDPGWLERCECPEFLPKEWKFQFTADLLRDVGRGCTGQMWEGGERMRKKTNLTNLWDYVLFAAIAGWISRTFEADMRWDGA